MREQCPWRARRLGWRGLDSPGWKMRCARLDGRSGCAFGCFVDRVVFGVGVWLVMSSEVLQL